MAKSFKLVREHDGLTSVFCKQSDAWVGSLSTDSDGSSLQRDSAGWFIMDKTGARLAVNPAASSAEPPEGPWLGQGLGTGFQYALTVIPASELQEEYGQQERLRCWDAMLQHLAEQAGFAALNGQVYDFGCGAGAVSKRLGALGAAVLGVDLNPEMLAMSKQSCPEGHFRRADLSKLREHPGPWPPAIGVWCSLAAAYFPGDALVPALAGMVEWLQPGGWFCVSEIDGLFAAHSPLAPPWKAGFSALEERMRVTGYDVACGGRLAAACESCGLQILDKSEWADRELFFQGPAEDVVLEAWAKRLARPGISALLTAEFGEAAEKAKSAFLACLRDPDHRTEGCIRMVICRRPVDA